MKATRTALISLLALASVTFLGKAYETSLRGIDSNIHAAVAMSATQPGPDGGIAPRLPIPIRNFSASAPATPGSKIDPDRVFNDHPFFLFWLNGHVMRALGPDAWSARVLTAAFSVGSVWLVYLIGASLRTPAFGLLAGLFLVACRDFVLTSATMSLDTALVFFIVLTFHLWLRRRWVALGIAAGIGLWVKTPLVLLVFPTAVIHGLISRRPGRLWREVRGLSAAGALAAGVGAAFWVYVGMKGGWELVTDYWVRQLWGTAVGGRGGDQGTQLGFFWHYVRTGFLPGLPFLAVALVRVARERRWRETPFLAPAIAVALLAAVVTAMRFKLGHYVTPAFPFLALISAYSVASWVERREDAFASWITVVATLLMATLLVAPIRLGPEAFVALKRFVPYIQTQGRCEDRIALVPGGEPVGSDLDYKLFLNFYAGREVEVLGCAWLKTAAGSASPPAWVILSRESYDQCLGPGERRRYPTAYRVGAQYMLSVYAPPAGNAASGAGEPSADAPGGGARTQVIDLTPLELELKAVTDCKAPPYPQDLWHRY